MMFTGAHLLMYTMYTKAGTLFSQRGWTPSISVWIYNYCRCQI